MKSAAQSAAKWVERAAVAGGDYVKGAQETTKDQAALAAAAEPIYKAAVIEAANAGRFGAGVRKAGKAKWLEGVQRKGEARFADGVANATDAYTTESARFDTARAAASSLPRGAKGSAGNLNRVKAVVDAQRAVKLGSSR